MFCLCGINYFSIYIIIMEIYKKLSIALILTFTIPILIPSRTLQYYWLKFTRKLRGRLNGYHQRNMIQTDNTLVTSFKVNKSNN